MKTESLTSVMVRKDETLKKRCEKKIKKTISVELDRKRFLNNLQHPVYTINGSIRIQFWLSIHLVLIDAHWLAVFFQNQIIAAFFF